MRCMASRYLAYRKFTTRAYVTIQVDSTHSRPKPTSKTDGATSCTCKIVLIRKTQFWMCLDAKRRKWTKIVQEGPNCNQFIDETGDEVKNKNAKDLNVQLKRASTNLHYLEELKPIEAKPTLILIGLLIQLSFTIYTSLCIQNRGSRVKRKTRGSAVGWRLGEFLGIYWGLKETRKGVERKLSPGSKLERGLLELNSAGHLLE